MAKFNRVQVGGYTVVYRGEQLDAAQLVAGINNPERRFTAGRGAPGILEIGGWPIVCRQYLHGGWFRGVTGRAFFHEGRALRGLEVTA